MPRWAVRPTWASFQSKQTPESQFAGIGGGGNREGGKIMPPFSFSRKCKKIEREKIFFRPKASFKQDVILYTNIYKTSRQQSIPIPRFLRVFGFLRRLFKFCFAEKKFSGDTERAKKKKKIEINPRTHVSVNSGRINLETFIAATKWGWTYLTLGAMFKTKQIPLDVRQLWG